MSRNIILKLEQIGKWYKQGSNKLVALQKCTLEIEDGEFVVVMGTSGSGKTTLLNIIGGMIAPSSGALFVRGNKVHFDAKHGHQLSEYRRREVGVVFQDFNLIEAMTVRENVAIPLILDGESAAVIEEKTEQMLKKVGLEQRGSFKTYELSGGQQQRVALARALIKQPAILLADEPTGNLDYKTSRAMLELLIDIQTCAKQTIVMVTHDPLMAAYGERVLFMHDGFMYEKLKLDANCSIEQRRDIIVTEFYSMKGMTS